MCDIKHCLVWAKCFMWLYVCFTEQWFRGSRWQVWGARPALESGFRVHRGSHFNWTHSTGINTHHYTTVHKTTLIQVQGPKMFLQWLKLTWTLNLFVDRKTAAFTFSNFIKPFYPKQLTLTQQVRYKVQGQGKQKEVLPKDPYSRPEGNATTTLSSQY